MEIRLALTGFGNVGQGLATLLHKHAGTYRDQYGVSILLTVVADRGGAACDREGLDLERLLRAKTQNGSVSAYGSNLGAPTAAEFLDIGQTSILVEAASTNFDDAEPGWTYVREAISRGIDVVFASKGSLALYWETLFAAAAERGVRIRFSATVGAPLPTLDIADRSLRGTDIRAIEGIVNGTTHQILSAMRGGLSYEEGVRQAQQMGIAETDPTLDVDGWDAAAKIAILSNAVFGTSLTVFDVNREGIRGVKETDLKAAAQNAESIKLIARAVRTDSGVNAMVRPEPRSTSDALGALTGDDMGTVFYAEPLGKIATTVRSGGHGGGISTAMTVLRDILNLAREGFPAP